MSCWAIVPIKERAACKGRLAPYLLPRSRRQLVDRLLGNVLRVLRSTRGIDQIAVVSPEHHDNDDVLPLVCARVGLNEDLDFGVRTAIKLGARTIVIVPPDLPYLESSDLAALIQAAQSRGAAIAPDHKEQGTNALAFGADLRLALSFGPESFRAHIGKCRAAGIDPVIVRRPGLAFDVDELDDWRLLSQHPHWSASSDPAQRRHAVV
jgi:2-phospho-L-lactate guanylyltransferase